MPMEAKEGFGCLGTGVTGSCKLSDECWVPNLGPLGELGLLLTLVSSFQSQLKRIPEERSSKR